MLIGQDYTPLAYLIRKVAAILETTGDLTVEKCYSATNKSLVEVLVARKSNDSACVKVNTIILFNHLDKASKIGQFESAIQAHEVPRMVRL